MNYLCKLEQPVSDKSLSEVPLKSLSVKEFTGEVKWFPKGSDQLVADE